MSGDDRAKAPTPVLLIGKAPAARALFETMAAMLDGADDVAVRIAPETALTGEGRLSDWIGQAVGDGAERRAITIAHGDQADGLIAVLSRTALPDGPVALLHPLAPSDRAPDGVGGRTILITAGATDPQTSPTAIGMLADALDEAGAKTEVFWNRGGAEITDAETGRLTAWFNAARGALVDPRTLPVAMETDGPKGRYFIEAPGGVTAEMTFSRASDTLIIIDHTEVPEAFRGTGTGLRLIEALITVARESDTKIIPLCPFAAAQFKRHPEWSDVLETKVRMKPNNRRPDR